MLLSRVVRVAPEVGGGGGGGGGGGYPPPPLRFSATAKEGPTELYKGHFQCTFNYPLRSPYRKDNGRFRRVMCSR